MASRSGSDDAESGGVGSLAETTVIGEDRIGVEADRGLQMKGIQRLEIRHREQSGIAEDGPIQRSERHAVEQRGHVGLVEPLTDRQAAQLSLEKVAGH